MAVYNVSDAQTLTVALGKAQAGDVITLAGGSYDVNLTNLNYAGTVTLKSLDAGDPAVFVNKTVISNVSNLTIDSVKFALVDVPQTLADSAYNSLVHIKNATALKVVNSEIVGQVIEAQPGQQVKDLNPNGTRVGYAAGSGVALYESKDVVFENNEIHDLAFGISFMAKAMNDNTLITGNHIHDIRTDGIRGTDHTGTVISKNVFENFHHYVADENNPNGATDDHSDMIQYWLSDAKWGVQDFTITDNVFKQDEGYTQTIFGHGRFNANTAADAALTNFVVEGNIIYNGHLHGITLGQINGAQVTNNVLLGNERVLDGYSNAPLINIGDTINAYVGDNVTMYSWDKAIRTVGDSKNNPHPELYAERNITIEDIVFISSNLGKPDYIFNLFQGLQATDLDVAALGRIILQGLAALQVDPALLASAAQTFAQVAGTGGDGSGGDSGGDTGGGTDGPGYPGDVDDADVITAAGYTRGTSGDDAFALTAVSADVNNHEGRDVFVVEALAAEKFHRIRAFGDDDVLDVRRVMGDFDYTTDNLRDFIRLEEVTWHGLKHTFVQVDATGAGQWARAVFLKDAQGLTLEDLIEDHQLLIAGAQADAQIAARLRAEPEPEPLAAGYTRGTDGDDRFVVGEVRADINNGEGRDVFVLSDLVEDGFHTLRHFGADDVLDLSAVLAAYEAGVDDLRDFIAFLDVVWNGAAHTIVQVDAQGGGDFARAVLLSGATGLDAAQMVADGQLVV